MGVNVMASKQKVRVSFDSKCSLSGLCFFFQVIPLKEITNCYLKKIKKYVKR